MNVVPFVHGPLPREQRAALRQIRRDLENRQFTSGEGETLATAVCGVIKALLAGDPDDDSADARAAT
jgi:hypothetical protein